MSHQDGRCASAEETYVVGPYESIPPLESLGTRTLVLIRHYAYGPVTWDLSGRTGEISVIGQTKDAKTVINCFFTEYDCLSFLNGSVYMKNVEVRESQGGGIYAIDGQLRLDGVSVVENAGTGLYLFREAFDIRHSVFRNNKATGVILYYLDGVLSGPLSFVASTIENNNLYGVSCYMSEPKIFQGVYVANNGDYNFFGCNFSSCPAPSSTCGAEATSF